MNSWHHWKEKKRMTLWTLYWERRWFDMLCHFCNKRVGSKFIKSAVFTWNYVTSFNVGKVTPDPKTHRDLIKRIWFNMYSRGRGRIGSSAFEHVFLSETKNGTITGLHNWVYFHDEETAGRADYKGWLKKVELGKVVFTFFVNHKHFFIKLNYK